MPKKELKNEKLLNKIKLYLTLYGINFKMMGKSSTQLNNLCTNKCKHFSKCLRGNENTKRFWVNIDMGEIHRENIETMREKTAKTKIVYYCAEWIKNV